MTGEQIVAEIDRAQRRDPSVVTVEPAFDGVAFAVLFFGAVLGLDRKAVHEACKVRADGRSWWRVNRRQQNLSGTKKLRSGLRDDAFRALRKEVSRKTDGKQEPEILQDDLEQGTLVLAR